MSTLRSGYSLDQPGCDGVDAGPISDVQFNGRHALIGRDNLLKVCAPASRNNDLIATRVKRLGESSPVSSPQAAQLLAAEADEVVILQTPAMLFAIGEWYERFEQLENEEVCRLLDLHRRNQAEPGASPRATR